MTSEAPNDPHPPAVPAGDEPPVGDAGTPTPGAATYRVTRQAFLRLLGLVYLVAFFSFWVQANGLVGSRGILPVKDFLERVRQFAPEHAVVRFPTLLWLNPTDGFLHFLCGAARCCR